MSWVIVYEPNLSRDPRIMATIKGEMFACTGIYFKHVGVLTVRIYFKHAQVLVGKETRNIVCRRISFLNCVVREKRNEIKMALILSSVSSIIIKLSDPLVREALLLYSVGNLVDWIERELRMIRSFLVDADANQENDERVKNWVRDVRDVGYDAEDVIDTAVLKVASWREEKFMGIIKKSALTLRNPRDRHDVGSEIEQIRKKIEEISQRRVTYGIQNIGASSSTDGRPQLWRLNSPNVDEPDFVGFKKDLDIIVKRLTEGEPRRCVVGIVGMGGLGKTTIAKKAYNHVSVQRTFHTRAWICITQTCSVQDVLLAIATSCRMLSSQAEFEEPKKIDVVKLKDEISAHLKGNQYLIVLDDVWANEAWDALKDAFPDANNGSRVLLTTRNVSVALYADPRSLPHMLRFLDENESWELFLKKTFLDNISACDLLDLGREIVRKCHGLPLAIVLIGGLLSIKEPRQWETVLKCMSWQLIEGEAQICNKILSLSYNDLPYDLKPCFLYLSIFPEDYEFSAEKLIQRWIAEGFLESRGNLTLEEVGEDCLMTLVKRSMVQVAKRTRSGRVKSCRIHDLLRDLSLSISREHYFLEAHHPANVNMDAPLAFRLRRLALHDDFTSLHRCPKHVRSVFFFTQKTEVIQLPELKRLFGSFKLLRVLDIRVSVCELPSEVGELIHLRYLRFKLSGERLLQLSSSIGNLCNLQTLYVSCSGLYSIDVPKTIEKLQQLRHFQVMATAAKTSHSEIGGCTIHPETRLDGLRNIRTLSFVAPGRWLYDNLDKLINIQKLGICLHSSGMDDPRLCWTIRKGNCLQSLFISADRVGPQIQMFLESCFNLRKLCLYGELVGMEASSEFQFPQNLTKLTLQRSGLYENQLMALGRLENLRILRLFRGAYKGTVMDFCEGDFPCLESFHVEDLSGLQAWIFEEGSMPKLSHLKISNCRNLRELPYGLQLMTNLKELELREMDHLRGRLQENTGEDWYKIQHIPSVNVHY